MPGFLRLLANVNGWISTFFSGDVACPEEGASPMPGFPFSSFAGKLSRLAAIRAGQAPTVPQKPFPLPSLIIQSPYVYEDYYCHHNGNRSHHERAFKKIAKKRTMQNV
jgi:hypothetical protein